MQLTPATEKALDAWLAPTSWHEDHPDDMKRFHWFVDQYQRDHGFTIQEDDLRDLIEKKTNSKGNDDLYEIIWDRVSLAYHILEFLETTRR